jgi:hypothetical protein
MKAMEPVLLAESLPKRIFTIKKRGLREIVTREADAPAAFNQKAPTFQSVQSKLTLKYWCSRR